MKKLFFILSFIIFTGQCHALVTDIGIDPLDQSSGAKPLAMGGAFTGTTGDVNSLFYNPAGIANADGMILTGSDLEKFYIKNYSMGMVFTTGLGHFGIGTVSTHYDDISINDTQTAGYEDNIALISYGVGSERLSFGLTLKSSMSQRLSIPGSPSRSVNGSGSDYDAGILWKPVNYASIGLVMRNISGSSYRFAGTDEAFPTSTRAGLVLNVIGKDSIYPSETYGLKAAYDSDSGKAGDVQRQNSYFGAECSYNDWLFFRTGGNSIFSIDSNVTGSSAGVGFKFDGGEVDFTSFRDPLTQKQTTYISLSVLPAELVLIKAREKLRQLPFLKDLLTVSFPDDYATDNENIIISGETWPSATILINGAQAYVDNDGSFRVIQPVNLGKNLIQITASVPGQTKTIEKKVLRNAQVIIAEEETINLMMAQETSAAEKDKLLEERNRLEAGRENVENLVTAGVINVPQGAKFQINSFISRGEMVSWLVIASGMSVSEVDSSVFKDVPPNHKYAPYIKAAYVAGIIKGDSNGKFRPDDPVKENEGEEFFKAFGVSQ